MKKIYSCLFILTFLISCDSTSIDVQQESIELSPKSIMKMPEDFPANADNPYDATGWLHNELMEAYYSSSLLPTGVAAISSKVEYLAFANYDFNAIKTSSYTSVSTERVQYLLDHESTCITDVISASSLTYTAKLSLNAFITNLVELDSTASDYTVIYDFIIGYEESINGNALLTINDKQIILTTSSVARYSTYMKRKKPKKNTDPDWEVLVTNIVAAADVAEDGEAQSIVQALVVGIAQN